MDLANKPAWLRSHQGLLDITQHHLYLPKDLGELTTLHDVSGFNRGLKQFLYWKGQLLPSCQKNTVFLAFLGQKGLAFKNVANVLGALRPLCNLKLLHETYSGANINFLALSFVEEGPISDIVSKFLFFEDCAVLPIVHRGDNTHKFRLLWLPPMFDVSRVHHLLSLFSTSHRLRRESISIGQGEFSNTNIVAGTITIPQDRTVDQLPYLIRLPTPHKGSALLYIEGRPPLCLKCREVGHTRRSCTMVRCTTCQMVHFPSSACGASSYSSVAAKGLTNVKDDDWIAHLDDNTCHDPAASSIIYNDDSSFFGKSGVHEDLGVPDSILPEPSSSPPNIHDNDISKKCDHTSQVSAGRTFPPETSADPSFIEFSSGLLSRDPDALDTPSAFTSISSEADITSKSSTSIPIVHNSIRVSSPPLTRSRSSKRRILSSVDPHNTALRSETICYTPYSSSAFIHDPGSSSYTTPLEADLASSFDNTDIMNSSAPDACLTYSDVEVDLSSGNVLGDVTSRKRKSDSTSLPEDSSSLDYDSSGASQPMTVSSTNSSTSVNSIILASSIQDDSPPTLSEEDERLACKFFLTSTELLSLKAACPGQLFTASIIKKLTLLHTHSIPILQVVEYPKFFSLAVSEITKRIKTVESTSSSPLTIADLLLMGYKYDIMKGLPVYTPTPPLCTDDPFNLKS